MIHISDFDADFKGRKFVDSTNTETYVIVGYGDNGSNGNPYLVGLHPTEGTLKTVLFKHVKFVP